MSYLIDRDALMELARNHINGTVDCNDIARFPTVDAEPVRHGRWIGSGEDVYCSECRNHPLKDMDKDSVYYWRYKPNYCPNCGAKNTEVKP